MSEITKLYENANIEKEVIKGCYEYYSELGIDIWKENDCGGKNCDTCKKDKSIKEYPQFTSEKQIAILITLANYNLYEDTKKLLIDSFNGEIYIGFYRDIDLIANATDKEFAECVAKLVNNLWQSLTEEERKQIKIVLQEDNQ